MVAGPAIHAWSDGSAEEFQDLIREGIVMHFPNDAIGDVIHAWARFSTADVFIMSKSSFSAVPGLLNKNCVVYQKFHQLYPLPSWLIAGYNYAHVKKGLSA